MMQVLWRHSRALWQNRQWRGLILGGTIAATLALLALGIIRGWPELIRYRWQFDWRWLALSGLMYACSLGLAVLAWIRIMHGLQAGSTWRQDAKFCLYSLIARRLPTPAPYIASRVLLYEEIGVPKLTTSVGLLWENLLLIAAGAIAVLLVLPLTPIVGERTALLPVLLVAGIGLLLVARPTLAVQAINWLLRLLGKAPLAIVLQPRILLLALVLYAGVWLMGGMILFCLICAIYPIGWDALPLILQGWMISGLASYIVFFAPVGFGVRELTMAAFLALVIPLSVAVVVVILVRLWTMANELLWALIFYRL
jgi:glycosyltransferase 2 family protein